MQHCGTNHRIRKLIWERHALNRARQEALGPAMCIQLCGQLLHLRHRRRVRIHAVNVPALAQQIRQVSSLSASRIQDAHVRAQMPAQDLVEEVDIDVAELFFQAERHSVMFAYPHTRGELRDPSYVSEEWNDPASLLLSGVANLQAPDLHA